MRQIIYADSYKAMWRVFILSDGQRVDTHWFNSPLKAIRYAYFLKKKTGLTLARKASELLSQACKEIKIQHEEQPTADIVSAPAKKTSRKSKKTKEVAA